MKRVVLDKYMDILGYNDRPRWVDKYLDCPSLLRLKNVGYFCGMDYASKKIYDFGEKISRYDHSVSVALITWRLTNDIRSTLAGLFHDIGTPCFSHVIDYMNKDYDKQESTEEKTEDIIRNDKYLCRCLLEDGILIEDIVDFKKYSIVDLDRPRLCADRLDGVILTGLYWTKGIDIFDVERIISDIDVRINEDGNEEICFKNIDVANCVVNASCEIDRYCHSKEDNYMMELLASITRRGIELGILSYDDLYVMDENMVFSLLDKCNDKELLYDLELFKNIDVSMIPDILMPKVKIRDLKPLVGGVRVRR